MDIINRYKLLIDEGNIEQAIHFLDERLAESSHPSDELLYLKGNAYRKMQNWQQALNCYMEAVAINPDSPARQAQEMLQDILNFYHKDLYNP